MNKPDYHKKRYNSALVRFLQPMIAAFFRRELRHYGPELSARLAERITELVEAACPEASRVKPGQLVWRTIAPETRADSACPRYVPVVLTLVDEEEVGRRAAGESIVTVRRDRVARLFEEAYEQGGLLSTRDAALLLHLNDTQVSAIRKQAEAERGGPLPHPGVLQDMGTTITHKPVVVRKVVYERQDPAKVARDIRHTQRAVDNYVKAFNRVRTIHRLKPDIDFIADATGMSKRLVKEYVKLIQEHENENEL